MYSPRPNGVVFGEERFYSSSPPLPASNPDPLSIGSESWARAERITREIVCKIQPTLAADHKRKEVVEYVQGLITSSVGCEVQSKFALLCLITITITNTKIN